MGNWYSEDVTQYIRKPFPAEQKAGIEMFCKDRLEVVCPIHGFQSPKNGMIKNSNFQGKIAPLKTIMFQTYIAHFL